MGSASRCCTVSDHFRLFFNARVRIDAHGKFQLFIGATDVGSGADTSLGQIVAEELDISLGAVRVIIADTELTPFDHGTY